MLAGWVHCAQLVGRFVFSGSGDGTVRHWDCASGATLGIFTGHTGGVSCLQVAQDTMVRVFALVCSGRNDGV